MVSKYPNVYFKIYYRCCDDYDCYYETNILYQGDNLDFKFDAWCNESESYYEEDEEW